MAIVSTSLTPDAQRLPLIGALGSQAQWVTQIPKAEIIFAEIGQNVTLSGPGDSQRLLINCILPPSYAYVFIEATVQLRETVAGDLADWDDQSEFFIEPSPAGPWKFYSKFSKDSVGAFSGGSATLRESTYELISPPLRKVIVPNSSASPHLLFTVSNVVENQAAMATNFFFRFCNSSLISHSSGRLTLLF